MGAEKAKVVGCSLTGVKRRMGRPRRNQGYRALGTLAEMRVPRKGPRPRRRERKK